MEHRFVKQRAAARHRGFSTRLVAALTVLLEMTKVCHQALRDINAGKFDGAPALREQFLEEQGKRDASLAAILHGQDPARRCMAPAPKRRAARADRAPSEV